MADTCSIAQDQCDCRLGSAHLDKVDVALVTEKVA